MMADWEMFCSRLFSMLFSFTRPRHDYLEDRNCGGAGVATGGTSGHRGPTSREITVLRPV